MAQERKKTCFAFGLNGIYYRKQMYCSLSMILEEHADEQ